MLYLVMDCETGGLDPENDALLEVGVALYDEDGCLSNFNMRIAWNGKKKISPRALAVNQIDPADGNRPEVVALELTKWMGMIMHDHQKTTVDGKPEDITVLGHSLQFDIAFITQFLKEHGFVGWLSGFGRRQVDTKALACYLQDAGKLDAEMSISLGRLYMFFFGQQISDQHSAGGDIHATFAVYREMVRCLREGVAWDSGTTAG